MKQPPEPKPDQSLEQLLAQRQSQLQALFPLPPPSPPKTRKALPALAVVLALGGLLAWTDPAYRHEQFQTDQAARRVVALSDGSQLTLDASSRVEVSWHLFSRRVDLQAGQALFDVAHARYRPFLVSAGAVQVRVLGTRFNVLRLDEQSTQVTLERGSVEVSGRGDGAGLATHMLPGERAAFSAGHLAQLSQVKASDASAWKDDQLVFQRTPLSEALSQINRYRSRPVRLDDPELGRLILNGVFDSRQTDTLLELLPGILPVRLLRGSDGSITISRK